MDLLVVDNDPAGSAAAALAECADELLHAVTESSPGISAARNRALDESTGHDVLVFIDDDERPGTDWLALLLATWARTDAAAVAGRVVPQYDGELDPWVRAGAFFVRPTRPTDTPIRVFACGNLLLDLRQVRALGVRFDPAFGLSGGEDTLFSKTLSARGGRSVWCHEAEIVDRVPPSRMTRRWVLRRAMSQGNTHARVELALAGDRTARARVRTVTGVGGVARVVAGVGRYAGGLATGNPRQQARGLRLVWRGYGMTTGAVGHDHREYARPPTPQHAQTPSPLS